MAAWPACEKAHHEEAARWRFTTLPAGAQGVRASAEAARAPHRGSLAMKRRSPAKTIAVGGWLWAAVVACVVLQLAAVYWPLLQRVLHTVSLKAVDWALITACAFAAVVVVELVKLIGRAAAPLVVPTARVLSVKEAT